MLTGVTNPAERIALAEEQVWHSATSSRAVSYKHGNATVFLNIQDFPRHWQACAVHTLQRFVLYLGPCLRLQHHQLHKMASPRSSVFGKARSLWFKRSASLILNCRGFLLRKKRRIVVLALAAIILLLSLQLVLSVSYTLFILVVDTFGLPRQVDWKPVVRRFWPRATGRTTSWLNDLRPSDTFIRSPCIMHTGDEAPLLFRGRNDD